MAYREIITYMTQADADVIRTWLNSEESIAWIILDHRRGRKYTWRAVDELDEIRAQSYAFWHKSSGYLTVPSGKPGIPDVRVLKPFSGWDQYLEGEEETEPWFGGNLPGPYSLSFRDTGRDDPNAIGRSGFHWAGDHFRLIGNPAPAEAKRWWQRLSRFVKANSTAVPWPYPDGIGRSRAYAFPDAYEKMQQGCPVDINP